LFADAAAVAGADRCLAVLAETDEASSGRVNTPDSSGF
jgi:hypothetical protein